MQGAQNVRSEAYLQVRRNDEGEAQRRRWTFYEAINIRECNLIVGSILSKVKACLKNFPILCYG